MTILGLGQPAAAFPAAPRGVRAGLLAVCGVTVAVFAVLGGLLAVRVDPLVGGLTAAALLEGVTLADGAWDASVALPAAILACSRESAPSLTMPL